MKTFMCVQGSDEWWELKCGVPSASNFNRIASSGPRYYVMLDGEEVSGHKSQESAEKAVAKLNKKVAGHTVLVVDELSAGSRSYIAELLAERACMSPNYFSGRGISRPMQNGIDSEPEARAFYSLHRRCDVQQVGFCKTDDDRFGCSPDGLVGDDGGLELKCPQLDTQFARLMEGTLPIEYRAQVHGALIVTGRPWWDFMSYAPGAEPLLIRVTPDEFTEKLRAALETFWAEYQKACARFLKREPGQEG